MKLDWEDMKWIIQKRSGVGARSRNQYKNYFMERIAYCEEQIKKYQSLLELIKDWESEQR